MIRAIETSGRLNASVTVPGSKSITNRALVCAALARGESRILHASGSDDTHRMINGLNQFGVLVRGATGELVVTGTGGRVFAPRHPIPVGNAGTTLRFLCSVAALAGGTTVFHADPRMFERPMEELLEALRTLGVSARGGGVMLGYTIGGGGLKGGTIRFRSVRSSQFLSSLLLVAPCAADGLRIELEHEIPSRPYLEMTLDVMNRFGVGVEREGERAFSVKPEARYHPLEYEVEPDASGATYFLAAPAISGGSVEVQGLHRSSLQGDVGFLDILARMGCRTEETPLGVRVTGGGSLQGVDVDMNAMPDAVPTLAVTALFASGPTRIRNIAHLRHKESDRIAALASELRKTGAVVAERDEELLITPSELHGALLDTHEDHRLAMSFALLGLRVPGIQVENPNCVRKSFPRFWEKFAPLRARA